MGLAVGVGIGVSFGRTTGDGFEGLRPRSLTLQPSVGTPTLAQAHALAASGLSLVPSVGTPLMEETNALTPEGLTMAPSVGTPALSQVHALTASGISAAPSVGNPALTEVVVAQITAVAMSAQNSTTGNVPVEITASADDTFNWILTSTDPGTSPPSVAQVNAGNGQDGTAAEDSGSVTTTGGTGVLDELTTGLNESLYLVVADVDSVHFDATAEAIDTRVPSLSSPTATAASATSIDAGVTSSLAGGEIFFAARLAADPVLSISDIENNTGNAVAIASDATPTADGNNAATLTGLTTDTAYDIDSFQRRLGQESAVATSAAATTWAVPDAFVAADWSVATGSGANELDITIASLPANNGSAITDLEYDIDASGTWISLGGTTGPFTITMAAASTSYAIRLRAVNAVGAGAAGNSESATSGAAAAGATYGDTISLDFGTGTDATAESDVGVHPSSNWINPGGTPNGSATDIQDQSGTATTAEVTFSNLTGNLDGNSADDGSANWHLFARLKPSLDPPGSFAFSEIPYAKYDVVVYVEEYAQVSGFVATISDGTTSKVFTSTNTTSGIYDGSLVEDTNYCRIEGLTSASVTITNTWDGTGSNFLGVAAIQIVERTD